MATRSIVQPQAESALSPPSELGRIWLRIQASVDVYAILAVALSFFAWAALLSPDYFMGAHDAHHSLFFPIEFDKGIQDGFWLPRWGPDFAFGYGYPMFVFYGPLSFYIWEGIHLTGLFGVVASTKATFFVGFVLAAAGMYWLARELWGQRAGLLASVVYTYLPYHLLNIYVRAALAEFVAMAFLPWILLAFYRLIRRPSLLGVAAAAGSYAALLATHDITSVLFTPFLGAFIVFELWLLARQNKARLGSWTDLLRRHALPAAAGIGFAIAITTAVWLPALAEQGAIKVGQWSLATYHYQDHFVYPQQLISPFWGFGYSVPGPGDGMSFQLGLAALGLSLLGTFGVLTGRIRFETGERPNAKTLVLFLAVCLTVVVALMLPPAVVVWNLFAPIATLVQFPWRLLVVASLPLTLLAGSAAPLLSFRGERALLGLMATVPVVIAASAVYTQPQFTPPNPRDETAQTWRDFESQHPDMVTMVAQTEVQPTTSPMLPALEANETPQRFQGLTDGITVKQLYVGGGSARARVVAEQPGTVGFLSYWYPGWYATLDGQPLPISLDASPFGLMDVQVPAGEHILYFRFGDPPLRQFADWVTIGSLLVLCGLIIVGILGKIRRGSNRSDFAINNRTA
jgi:6-pyruvoyl-tetrahydropterin synthase related domain